MDFEDMEMMKISDLAFDLENPRLVEFDLPKNASDADVMQVVSENMAVRELALSIATCGFFRHEPLMVVRESGKNIVIEGNRRLAAVKVLLEPSRGESLKITVPEVSEDDREALMELPVARTTRESAWRYIGFKHINGPAKWSLYAKSEFIARVHRDYGVPLDDIARQIGDTHRIVQRLFRGIMVLKQSEQMKVFNREDHWRRRFFVLPSLLWARLYRH